ncbi:cytochrome c-type biogenesis protein [Bartonella sp. 1-1C]|uniref:cytochrome c-type biogenesis protein n=1 Tax=Bartonella sp. 1-1C TaxID=515256 RepID=UPI0001F4BBCF|nr:cytochrome c-type biogenesis protein [Bartonella sp. 1-1C]ATO57699.1 cytochrome c-type biogenesis protein CcmH [Bartonella sp. 1-1C]CBI80537.1 Cytochrome c-type biogenesis protein ccmH [Bartonella sp. 1-1C]
MRKLFFWILTVFTLIFSMQLVGAVEPDEILMDPVLERRARDISSYLRCPVCQNQTIDDSNSSLARDLRLLVRERLKAGDNDQQIIDFLVEQYGEFILLTPPFNKTTWFLWLSPLIIIIIGVSFILFRIRWARRKTFISFDAN